MSIFRSAEMKFFNIHIPKEDTYEVISRLAEHNFVQFIDCTKNAFYKPYYNSLKRCDEVITKINHVTKEIHKNKIDFPEVPNVEYVFEQHRQYVKKHKMTALAVLEQVLDAVDSKYDKLEKANRSIADFNTKINQLENYKYLLFKAREVFHLNKVDSQDPELDKYSIEQLRLVNVSGVIYSRDVHKFTKMIFRVTKGNSILYTFTVPKEDHDTDKQPMTAFICVVETGGILLTKLNKICDSFGVKKYKLPTNKDDIFEKIKQIEETINDTRQLSTMAEKQYLTELNNCVSNGIFDCSEFDAFRILLERESIIFNTLNMMEETNNIMIGQIWVPTEKIGLLYTLMPSFVSLREGESDGKPPTHFEMNQFTTPFQEIVNTYGVPRYQEVNPALYAIPVFPFLFGVMFGDIGHGGVLLAVAIWMVFSEQAKKLLPDVHAIRYLLLLMGIFSFYSGWIYNEFFSIPLNVFGTCYGQAHHEEYAPKEEGCVYPFGFDPKWIRASNELNYFNSYKMKFAVIIGVFQMSFAILLKMLNTYHFKNYLDFFFEWLPQQMFFFSTFGYMCLLIIYKWTIPWGTEDYPTDMAPSIIGQMIALPLKMGSTEDRPLWNQQSQESLQFILLVISLICVPLMLIPKPLIIGIQLSMKKKKSYNVEARGNSEEDLGKKLNEEFDEVEEMVPHKEERAASTQKSEHADEHEDISQIAVHQIIETIEFVLGSISNTASYLRLWALSLAHGQLSRVFLEKTVGGGIETGNILIILIGMYLFFNITLGVIMGMDSMQCFLHALRLQWVEFQSKFFKADGWKFMPLTFVHPIQLKANQSRVFE